MLLNRDDINRLAELSSKDDFPIYVDKAGKLYAEAETAGRDAAEFVWVTDIEEQWEADDLYEMLKSLINGLIDLGFYMEVLGDDYIA